MYETKMEKHHVILHALDLEEINHKEKLSENSSNETKTFQSEELTKKKTNDTKKKQEVYNTPLETKLFSEIQHYSSSFGFNEWLNKYRQIPSFQRRK